MLKTEPMGCIEIGSGMREHANDESKVSGLINHERGVKTEIRSGNKWVGLG